MSSTVSKKPSSSSSKPRSSSRSGDAHSRNSASKSGSSSHHHKDKSSSSSKKPKTVSDKKLGDDFIFKVKYRNDLPPIPFDPKLMAYPFEKDRHYKYSNSGLHQSKLHKLYGPGLENGVPCSPFGMGFIERQFKFPGYLESLAPNVKALDPADKELLAKPVEGGDKRRTTLRPIVPWLRRTGYIETSTKTSVKDANSGIETKMGISIMRDEKLRHLLDQSPEGQIRAINNTFTDAAKASLSNLKHPTNPDLKPVEIIPIFPDFENWPNQYYLASYPSDPTVKTSTAANRNDTNLSEEHALQLEEALLKPLEDPDDHDETWVAYYSPTPQSVPKLREKRKRIEEFGDDDEYDQVYEYKFCRDCDHTIEDSQFPLFLEIRTEEGGAFYSKLMKKIGLKPRRNADKDNKYGRPTKIMLKSRPLTEEETSLRTKELKQVLQREEDLE